nr:3-deoxy-D-manno-octulosonic acid kinase [Photobacterium carnosum]
MPLAIEIVKYSTINAREAVVQEIISNNQAIWFDSDYLSADPHGCFDIEYWRQRDAVIGSAKGRGTTWFVADEKLEMALRHYHRGGLFAKVNNDRYWFTDWNTTRSGAELALLKLLRDGGVNVPRPIAARAVKKGMAYKADILVEKIANSHDLVALLQSQTLVATVWRDIGEMIGKMHDLQVCHTDLNAHNILLDDGQQPWLIDFDKCDCREGDDWKVDNLARLKRSFLKEVDKRAIKWCEDDWNALCDGYASKSQLRITIG